VKSLGMDLGKLAADAPALSGAPDCPGARLRVTRSDYETLRQGGEWFVTKHQEIPVDGYGDARVACRNQVATLPKTAAGHEQYYGLCHSCSGLEADNRQTLRERAKVRGER
jgi:hypothetical protein